MKRFRVVTIAAALFCALSLSSVCFGFEIEIKVSPNVLNIASNGEIVTVHTDIPYKDVDVSAVFLNGVHIHSWKSDNRGYFVAKFLMEEVEKIPGLNIGEYNTLILTGVTTDGVAFSGETEILVVDIEPRGKG
jgi:hypothetical protein